MKIKKKIILFCTFATLITLALIVIIKFNAERNNVFWVEWNYSSPLKQHEELNTVIMSYVRAELTETGYSIIMNISNNSQYWIQRRGLGSFHRNPATSLEYFDGIEWRVVPTNDVLSFTVLAPFMPIPAETSEEARFLIEFYFGMLNPGLYRIRLQYIIYSGINIYDITTLEERENIRVKSRNLGPHDVVGEFYWR